MQSEVTVRVRHPEVGEILPGEYRQYPAPDPDWVWMCEGEQGIAGYLMASPCHGMVMMVRAIKVTGRPANWLLSCIRQARRECAERGYEGWFMPLAVTNDTDQSIFRIARRFASVELEPRVMVTIGGKICQE